MKKKSIKKKFSSTKGKPGVGMKRVISKVKKIKMFNKIKGEKMEDKKPVELGTLKSLHGQRNILVFVPTEIADVRSLTSIQKGVVLLREIYDNGYNETVVYWRQGSKSSSGHFKSTIMLYQPGEEDMEEHRKGIAKDLFKDPYAILAHYFTIGADPEVFVGEEKKLIPAFNFLPSKKSPVSGQNNRAYWDGFQAEFDVSVTAPTCLDSLTHYIRTGLKLVLDTARKKYSKATLMGDSVVDIDPVMLADGKEEHVQFGCMPSFNAYGMKRLELHGREVPFRPAGGHMHFGIGKTDEAKANQIVRAMDAIIGVASVSMFGKWDDDRRRQLYGLAGEYRLPKHGLEYRVLSNAWTFHPLLCYMSFDLARKALVLGQLGILDTVFKTPQEEVIRVINRNDIDGARAIMKENKKLFLAVMQAAYGAGNFDQAERAEVAFEVWMRGADFIVKDRNNFEKNWQLDDLNSTFGSNNKRFREAFSDLKKRVS